MRINIIWKINTTFLLCKIYNSKSDSISHSSEVMTFLLKQISEYINSLAQISHSLYQALNNIDYVSGVHSNNTRFVNVSFERVMASYDFLEICQICFSFHDKMKRAFTIHK